MPWPPAAVTSSAVSSMVSGRGDFSCEGFLEFFLETAAGAVDRRSGLAEGDGDAASGAASGSGDQDDFALQGIYLGICWRVFLAHYSIL